MRKEERVQAIALNICYEYNLSIEVIELFLQLVTMPKWVKKPETAIRLSIKKLAEFQPAYQKVLIESAISGNYQGLIFSDSKQKEITYLKSINNEPVSKISRLQRIISSEDNRIQFPTNSLIEEGGC